MSLENTRNVVPNGYHVRILVLIIMAFAVLNVINVLAGKPFWPITRHIDLGSDINVAAWFSSILLAIGGLVAVQCASRSKELFSTSWRFLLVALLMFAMSCDELARLHETIYGDLAKSFGVEGLSFAKNAAWVWVGGPVIAITFVAIVMAVRKDLIKVPGVLTALSVGLGVMFLGGVVLESSINFLNKTDLKMLWDFEVIVEETLETLGTMIIITGLIKWRDSDIIVL